MIFGPAPVITFNYRGEWSSSNTYSAGDAVRSPTNGYLYVATDSVASGGSDPGTSRTNPPAAPPNPWAFAVSQPVDQGPVGPMGADGTDGSSGASFVGYFQESVNEPAIVGDSYSGGTFVPPTGWTPTAPVNPRSAVWLTTFRLEGDGRTYMNLGVIRLSGYQGERGQDGQDGQRGLTGNRGTDGAPGTNGFTSRIIFRKSLSYELTTPPSVQFDGTNLDLPDDDMNAWSLEPYVSKVQGFWSLAGSGNNAPDHANMRVESIAVDTSVQPNVVYVLDAFDHGITSIGGYVYRYRTDGMYLDRWALDQNNDTAIDLDVRGSYVRVLDGRTTGSQNVYVYNKEDGGRQSNLDFPVPNISKPYAHTITTHGNSIYLTNINEIRRFDLNTNIEQMTGGLGSLTLDPIGSDTNDYYFFILDSTSGVNKVIVRDINTLSLRHTIREWNVTSASPSGIAVGEFEVLVLDTAGRNVYRYYNPDNILWGSVVYIDNNRPFPNIPDTTAPFDMTGQRGSGGGIIVQGTGTGSNGNSIRLIFREVAQGAAAPSTPSTTEGHYSGGNYNTPPSGWHLTGAEAITDFSGDGDLYTSVVTLSGNGNTIISYGAPFRLTGNRGAMGLPGAAAAAGNSVEFIYRAATSEPPAPTGGTFIGATRVFTPPSGWAVNPPGSIPSGQNLYLVEAVLPGQGTDNGGTIAYRHPFTAPRGGKGDTGDTGPTGAASTVPGPAGEGFKMIFMESTTVPSTPTGGSWDGSRFRSPSGWSLNTPPRTENDPENLYACIVDLPGGGGTPLYNNVFRLNGPKGDQGQRGETGIRGIGTDWIFQRAGAAPSRPVNGSGSWNPETGAYTTPAGWSLDISSSSLHLYAVKVTLPGNSTTPTYTNVVRLDGPQGIQGIRGPAGTGTGGGLNNGDSIYPIYKRSNTDQNSTILAESLTGGTWDHTTRDFSVAPATWNLTIPAPADGRYVYASIATLSGSSNTIEYSRVFQWSGSEGPRGMAGTDGNPGAQGERGFTQGLAYVYRADAGTPTAITGTQGLYNDTTGLISNAPSGWSGTPPSITGNQRLWISIARVNQTGTNTYSIIGYSSPIPLTGHQGQQGERGIPGTSGGMGGVNADIPRFIYQRATAPPANPSGGTWVESSRTYTPPSGWYTDESQATGSGILYAAVVTLSGSDNTIVGYTNTIRLQGPQGQRGERGATGPTGVGTKGDKGDKGDRGDTGPPGYHDEWLFQWSPTRPAAPSGLSYNTEDGTLHGTFNNWHITADATPPNEGDLLWGVQLKVEGTNVIYLNTFQISGPTGAPSMIPGPTGPPGPQGINARVEEVEFGFNFDISNHTLTSRRVNQTDRWPVVSRMFSDFTGAGEAGLATVQSNGIRIEADGIYNIILQVGVRVVNTTYRGVIDFEGVIFRESRGGNFQNQILRSSHYSVLIDDDILASVQEADFIVQITIPILALQQGDKFLFEYNYRPNHPSRHGNDTSTLVTRIDDLTLSEENVIVRRFSAAPLTEDHVIPIFTLSTSTSTSTPAELGTWNGTDYDPPTGWTEQPGDPSSTQYVLAQYLKLQGRSPYRITALGTPKQISTHGGPKGDSIKALWHLAGTAPSSPSANSISINSQGVWTDLTDNNNVVWSSVPVTPHSGLNQYQQDFEVDYSTNPPTLTTIGTPWQNAIRGQQGIQGTPGIGGWSQRTLFRRTMTDTAPSSPAPTWNGSAIGNLGDWGLDTIPSGGGDYIWSFRISYQFGRVGIIPTTVLPYARAGATGATGAAGQSEVSIYRGSATDPGTPTGGTIGTAADPTTYTAPAGWSLTPPARNTTEDIYRSIVTIPRTGTTPTYTRSFFLEARSMVTPPPPSRTTYSNGFEYGIANGQTPSSTLENSAAFTLAVGESHTTPEIDFPDTTASNTSYFIRLPAGLTLVSARESVDGTVTSHWVRVGATQVWTYFIGFGGSNNLFSFTIRRDS